MWCALYIHDLLPVDIVLHSHHITLCAFQAWPETMQTTIKVLAAAYGGLA